MKSPLISSPAPLLDPANRRIDYLRLSLTDQCNERCLYCSPQKGSGSLRRESVLTPDAILRIVQAATALGFRKFRLTGGEPLLRPDIVEIAQRLWDEPGVEALGMSTNGMRLAPLARSLKQAGMRSVNISLDALDAALYHRITGGRLEPVLEGIRAAIAAGFEQVKLNCVLLRGLNENQIRPLILFAAEHQVPLRFIELMPLTSCHATYDARFISADEIMEWIARDESIEPAPLMRLGHGPAQYYRLGKSGATVGFVRALSDCAFCERCNKLRLTSRGELLPCLGRDGAIDLRGALADPQADLELLLRQAIANKPLHHGFGQISISPQPRPMVAIGG